MKMRGRSVCVSRRTGVILVSLFIAGVFLSVSCAFALVRTSPHEQPDAAVSVTDVRIVRGELIGGWFQPLETVDEVWIGDLFLISVNVTNNGSQTEPVSSLYNWVLSPTNRVDVVGNVSFCRSTIQLGPGNSTSLLPFCLSQGFKAKEAGWVTLNITVKDWMDETLCEYTVEFEIVDACMDIKTSGYYALTTDIINSSAQCCINITASDVIFDGLGHVVDGMDAFSTCGVCVGSPTALRNVTVINVTVTDWGYSGIIFNGVEDGRIEQCTAASNDYGIILFSSANNTIIDNTAASNTDGIYSFFSDNNTIFHNAVSLNYGGIGFTYSSNNTVCNNTAEGNKFGIDLYQDSNNNSIANNTIHNSYDTGIYLSTSQNNTIRANNVSDNNVGINLSASHYNCLTNNIASNNNDGIRLDSSSNNILMGNSANLNNKYGIRLDSSGNNNLTGNTANSNNNYGIRLDSSGSNNLTGNTANSNNNEGIYLRYSIYSNLTGNTASNNDYGVYLENSGTITLTGNSANLNNNYGIYLSSSINNLIYNNYFDNTNNAYDDGNNIWTITKTAGTNILGGSWLGGNAWLKPDYTGFSQTCSDADADGICDDPYELNDYNIDYLPLKAPTPVSVCREINTSGNYVLTCDLECAKDDCIRIRASDVVFDGDGHTIKGNTKWTTYGVYVYNESTVLENVTVKNLIVTHFDYGCQFDTVRNSTILWNTFLNNTGVDGIGFADSNDCLVAHNNASYNRYGLILWHSCNNTITNNTLEFNREGGLGIGLTSTGNSINGNILCYNNRDIDDGDANCGCNNTCETPYNWNDTGSSGCTYSNCWYRRPRRPCITAPDKNADLEAALVSGLVAINVSAEDPLNNLIFVNLSITGDSLFQEIPLTGTRNGWWNWSGMWNTTGVDDGEYLMTATSTYDTPNFGLVRYSTELPLIVDNTPPTVVITTPLEGAIASDLTVIEANASDANGIDYINFDLGDLRLDTDYDGTNRWFTISNLGNFSEGPNTLRAEALDFAGNRNISEINVTLSNPHIGIQSVSTGGPYKLYTIGENEVNVTVTLNNSGLVNGTAVVRLEGLPEEVEKQFSLVKVAALGNATTNFKFSISEYDWMDGWYDKGFDSGSFSFMVNVTNLLGTMVYDNASSRFEVKEGPQFLPFDWGSGYIDYESNGNGTVEVGEYFLLNFWIANTGDEDVTSIYITSDSPERPYGFTADCGLAVSNQNGLQIGEDWNTGHMAIFPNETKEHVAELYKWTANTAGLARLNFVITYKDTKGIEHETVLLWPIEFPIYDYKGKTLKESKVVKEGYVEVTVYGIEGTNVSAKIRNTGGVYYTYKIDEQPTGYWNELRSFLAPGMQRPEKIPTQGVPTNYKFTISYDYSGRLNTLDGLLNAISPYLAGTPFEYLPTLIDILLVCAGGNIDEQKLAEQGMGYLFDELTDPESEYHKAVVALVEAEYGEDVKNQLLTGKNMDRLCAMPMAFYKGLQWTWNNLNDEMCKSHTFVVNVTDPPDEYSVNEEMVPQPLFFGVLSSVTSSMGEGNITISFTDYGEGEYRAAYEINTSYTSLNDTDFDVVPTLLVSEYGRRNTSMMEGNVTILLFLAPESPAELYEMLLADTGFAESLIESYFVKLESYEVHLLGDHIELKGNGELMSSIYDDEISITIKITMKKIEADYYKRGRYAAVTSSGFQANISFGPRFNIPLNNTRLSISIPYENASVSPEPDYTNTQLHWAETPTHVDISFSFPVISFDTGPGTYPSISGRHNGTITPSYNMSVSSMYTFPCPGTGGHTEYAALSYSNGTVIAEARWDGYREDWHNLTFNKTFTLYANETYRYTIQTGSYPLLHQNETLLLPAGEITCTQFTDANGRIAAPRVPAIKFF